MDDVTSALQRRSPHSRASTRLREEEMTFDGGTQELESILRSGQESVYPASKRRRLSMNTESTSPESFDIGEWLTTGNETLKLDSQEGSDSESDDDVPAFFHPSKFSFS
jgi:hypothetical protein